MVGASSTAPMVLPQVGQKARLDFAEERQSWGCASGANPVDPVSWKFNPSQGERAGMALTHAA
jgi:hypothetical protein